MKSVFTLILLIPIMCAGQVKGDNTIMVNGVSFEQITQKLIDDGFDIEKKDAEYKTIKTEYKPLCSGCLPEIMFNIRIKDSVAIIKGKWRSTGNILGLGESSKDKENALVFDIQVEKSKVPKKAFESMQTFALSFGKPVEYKKN